MPVDYDELDEDMDWDEMDRELKESEKKHTKPAEVGCCLFPCLSLFVIVGVIMGMLFVLI